MNYIITVLRVWSGVLEKIEVIDTEDKYIEAEAPIIVFNRDEATKKLSVSELPAKWSEGRYKLREEEKNTKASKLATEI